MSALSNIRWVGLGQVAKIATQLMSVLILSRLLSTTEFGLIAMTAVVANLALIIRDLGTAAAIIQRSDLQDVTVSAAYWLSLCSGTFVGIAVAATSMLFGLAFHRPDLAPILCVLAISFPLSGLSTAHQALLERQNRFSTVARIEILSNGAGLAAAVVAALCGAGAYSMAAQSIVAAGLCAAQLLQASKWRPTGNPGMLRELRSIWRYSGGLVGFNLVNFFSRNADSMIIGRVLGASALGPYSLAYRVMLFPIQNFTFVIQRALFPIFSRPTESLDNLRRLYLRAFGAVAAITMPLMTGAYCLRFQFVQAVLGAKWSEVAVLLGWLAPTAIIQSLISTTGIVFMSRGRTSLLMRLGVLGAILQVCAFLIGAHWQLVGVVRCYFLANVINALPPAIFVMRTLGGSIDQLLAQLVWPATASLIMALSLFTTSTILHQFTWDGWIQLAAGISIGSASYAAALVLLAPRRFSEVRSLLRRPVVPAEAGSAA